MYFKTNTSIDFLVHSLLALGTITSEIRVVWVFASSTVGTKEIPVCVLQLFGKRTGLTFSRGSIFTILTSPALSQMPGIPAIASVRRLSIFVQGFEATSSVEAMSISTFNSWNLTVIAKPAVGTFL